MSIRPRVSMPSPVKPGQIVEVKTLVSHVMETGQRKDGDGKTIPRNIIHTFTAVYNGKQVFQADLQPGISANPYIAFHLRVQSGGELVLSWTEDNGTTMVEKLNVAVA